MLFIVVWRGEHSRWYIQHKTFHSRRLAIKFARELEAECEVYAIGTALTVTRLEYRQE